MALIESQLIDQNDQTITLQFTTSRGKTHDLTVINHPDYTVEQLVQRWTSRAKREYMSNPAMFERMFINRINRRHQTLVAQPQ